MNSFSELHWLAKADKYILLPPVIFADILEGGYFRFPEKKEVLIEDKYYPADRGLIVINSTYPENEIQAGLAHEWRHLWQYYQWGEPELGPQWDSKSPLSYREQIVDYFISNPSEYDALLFELKKAPSDLSQKWYEWILARG